MITASSARRPKTLKAFGRAVIIGLGGTGQKALLEIKRNFQNNCGTVPSSIRFLVLDTDQPEQPLRDVHGGVVEFTANEFCRLRVSLVRAAIRSPYVQDWWISYPAIDTVAITDGAGGIREMGRLALFSCIDQVKRRIDTVYNEMKAYGSAERMERDGFLLLEGSEQVIVVGSLSGGTGGGLFFDMSILCHALGGESFRYMAYVVMPWVYRNLANTAYANTYAGLTELNQLASLSARQPLSIRYSDNLECKLEECPYHIVNLVDGLCDNGERITSASDLAGFIGESVYHLTGALGVHAKSVYDNIMTRKRELGPTRWKGCKALYSAIGVANIRYPAPEIHRAQSCELTAELLDLLRAENLQQAAQSPATAADDPAAVFIEQHRLKPTKEALLRRLLPEGTVGLVSIDDELENITTHQELVELVEKDAGVATEKARAAIAKIRTALATEVSQKLRQLLDQNPGKRDETLAAFAASFKSFKDKLVQASQTCAEESDRAREQKERAEAHLPAENSFVGRVRGFKGKARAFVQASNDHLLATCSADAVSQAMELIDELVTTLQNYGKEKGLAQQASESLADQLLALARAYRLEAAECRPGRNMARKRFDYILGVDDTGGDDDPYFWHAENDSLPKADALLREIASNSDLKPALLATLAPDQYADRLFKFVGEKCQTILTYSAMAVLAANKEKALKKGEPDPTYGLIQRALGRSTLLLPLRQEELVLEPQSIRDIMVIGIGSAETDGKQRARAVEENKKILRESLPEDVREYTNIAHTEEPYCITVTRYKAIFPLHAIQGMEELRRAYDESVLPPSHIDRRSLFNLDDPLPQENTHHLALKLLTLSMMKCFGIIEHRKERSGGSYFKPAKELDAVCLDSYDDRNKLPGKPGKFYALVDEISRRHFDDLRAGIENEIRRRAAVPGFLPVFFAEAKDRETEFRARVENVATGLRKEVILLPGEHGDREVKGLFNKTVTGRYYRRQADFLREIERKHDYIEERIKKGDQLIDILLDRDAGFKI